MKLQTDPFRNSVMARAALVRALAIAACLIPLWLAIAWAVSLP